MNEWCEKMLYIIMSLSIFLSLTPYWMQFFSSILLKYYVILTFKIFCQ